MSDIPRRTAARTAKLASLPLGVAGRAAAGWGRRLAGGNSEEISAQLMARSAEQLFAVLGELKGGAMKFGQALSVFEAAVPDELAGPFRESLTKLQHAAPPMPTRDVHRMLAEQFGRRWPERFREFDETPAAAASIGQVHRAVWHDGRDVAVKVQYPGAEEALRSDLRQLSRMSRLLQPLVPGQDVKPLIDELRERMEEELDYRDEAANQRAFAEVFADDPLDRGAAGGGVGAPRDGERVGQRAEAVGGDRERYGGRSGDQAGALLAEFHYSAPARSGLLHADPHPGNFQLLPDGRLLVLDFGAVARLPEGLPQAAVGDDPARAGGPAGRPRRPAARRGVPAAGDGGDRRRPDRVPRPVRRAAAHRDLPLHPSLVAEPGRAGRRPAQLELRRRPAAEPAAAVPAACTG